MGNSSNFETTVHNLLINLKIDITKIKHIEYFYQAFTHTTFANEHRNCKSFQYLEFLGDAILQYVISNEIFKRYPDYKEGEATRHRSAIVSNKNLSNIAKKLGLMNCVRTGKNAFINGKNEKIDSDFFESFIAAYYLEFNLNKTIEFLQKYLFPSIEQFSKSNLKDPKTIFQEFIQMHSKSLIHYHSEEKDNEFVSLVIVDGQTYGIGKGKSKKEAEKAAARNALEHLNF
ncbi:ribonuclease III [Metamycoplasma buccale]|uniref:ribonuclease III n=1 Tax=Metamycoplasma buccale TaxID=55602 RepID=UPI00398F1FC7